MKQLLYILTFLLYGTVLPAQGADFAPVGAKWYYTEVNFALKVVPHIVESVGKENYQGKWCSKLVSSSNDILANPAYVYTENDTVYYFNPGTNQFQLIYDFRAEVGDFWTFPRFSGVPDTVTVDSISNMVVSGDTLKVWHVSTSFWIEWGKRIIEKVGNDQLFVPKFGLVEAYVWGLRCFESPDAVFHFVPYPCDTTYNTLNAVNFPTAEYPIQVFPNPFRESISINAEAIAKPLVFRLFDNLGRQVVRQTIVGKAAVNTQPLPPGIYFWSVELEGVIVKRGKRVKE